MPAARDKFAALGLEEPLLRAVEDLGYEAPTPVQVKAVPPLLEGRDVVGRAATGTGKTTAFAAPILQGIDLAKRSPQALVLTPTRELALQVAEAFSELGTHLEGLHVLAVYGGQPLPPQVERLRRGVHVVVGTPGRILDHLHRQSLDLSGVKTLVLDEADRMLDLGFLDEVEAVIEKVPKKRQTGLFSATIPAPIRRVAEAHLTDAVTVEVEGAPAEGQVALQYLSVRGQDKMLALTRLLDTEDVEGALVFVRTTHSAGDIALELEEHGFEVEPLHGNMSQVYRERVVARLRARHLRVVICTDVAARGLDVPHLSHVIHYDLPDTVDTYVHRLGRTGRAGRRGTSIMFVTPPEQRELRRIEHEAEVKVDEIKLPTHDQAVAARLSRAVAEVADVATGVDLALYEDAVAKLVDGGLDPKTLAAAAIRVLHGDRPVTAEPEVDDGDETMVRIMLEVGKRNRIRTRDILAFVAQTAEIPGRSLGAIDVQERRTFVDVPSRYEERVMRRLRHAELKDHRVQPRIIPRADERLDPDAPVRRRPGRKRRS